MNESEYLSEQDIDLKQKKSFILAGRRTGKTELCIKKALNFLEENPGKKILWICSTETQMRVLKERIPYKYWITKYFGITFRQKLQRDLDTIFLYGHKEDYLTNFDLYIFDDLELFPLQDSLFFETFTHICNTKEVFITACFSPDTIKTYVIKGLYEEFLQNKDCYTFFYTIFSHRINEPVEERVFSLKTLFFKKEQETEMR
jgi:hypothetical protein